MAFFQAGFPVKAHAAPLPFGALNSSGLLPGKSWLAALIWDALAQERHAWPTAPLPQKKRRRPCPALRSALSQRKKKARLPWPDSKWPAGSRKSNRKHLALFWQRLAACEGISAAWAI
jgi:hypothetical protein